MTVVRRLASAALASTLLLLPLEVTAQDPVQVTGKVSAVGGASLEGANVFLLETLEGDLTDPAGLFSFSSTRTGGATLAVRRFGYLDVELTITLPVTAPLSIEMSPQPIELEPIRVEAGGFRLGNLPDVSLTDLDVVTTPGAAADPFRAIQTFPGLQNVGEGAELFVRGGDASETKVILDGATMISPFRLDTDRTISFGRFDPFMLDGIFFSAGGFGVEYGDALSGITDLTTVGKPIGNAVDLTASIADVSGRVSLDVSDKVGFRATATLSDTDLLMRLNGRRSEFDRVPQSTDLSGGMQWEYGGTGQVKAYALRQTDAVGVRIEEPSFAGTFNSDQRADIVAISGVDSVGRVDLSWTLATSGSRQDDDFGAFRLERDDRLTQARVKADVALGRGASLSVGGEWERRRSDLTGSIPQQSSNNAPGAPVTVFASPINGTRVGGFSELEIQPWNALRLAVGARVDHSTLTGDATADPRLSVSYRPAAKWTFTGAWGVFHQLPDIQLFEPVFGDPSLSAMSARHLVGGVSFDDGSRLVRVEAYRKTYRALASTTRDNRAHAGGVGDAAGLDVFLKDDLGILGLAGRLAYSFVDSQRTDPDSDETAPAPFDVTHTLNAVVTRTFGSRLQMGAAYRVATGRPITPILSATFDTEAGVWDPRFGDPFSERLPTYSRFDLSANLIHSFWPDNLTVFFVAVMNVFDRHNVSDFNYSSDYTERLPLRSPFSRTFYFGATTSLPF